MYCHERSKHAFLSALCVACGEPPVCHTRHGSITAKCGMQPQPSPMSGGLAAGAGAQSIGRVGSSTELIIQHFEEVEGRGKRRELLAVVRAVVVRSAQTLQGPAPPCLQE